MLVQNININKSLRLKGWTSD